MQHPLLNQCLCPTESSFYFTFSSYPDDLGVLSTKKGVSELVLNGGPIQRPLPNVSTHCSYPTEGSIIYITFSFYLTILVPKKKKMAAGPVPNVPNQCPYSTLDTLLLNVRIRPLLLPIAVHSILISES